MIRSLFVHDKELAKALEIALNLEKIDTPHSFEIYKKWGWVIACGDDILHMKRTIQEEYDPDSFFLFHLGRSIDTEHEIGDIILPNVFFECNTKVCTTEITKENRDDFVQNPIFLEIFDQQKDYYVEDFGLSIWGIAVSKTISWDEHNDALMMAYAGDVYFEENLDDSIALAQDEHTPVLLLTWVLSGRKPSGLQNPYTRLAANCITAIKLFLQEAKTD